MRDAMADDVVRLESVTREFFDGKQMRTVLQKTDLGILPGELTVLAGPSGSGKPTLLTIIGLVLAPTKGGCSSGATRSPTSPKTERACIRLRDFGFVFQQAALVPSLP